MQKLQRDCAIAISYSYLRGIGVSTRLVQIPIRSPGTIAISVALIKRRERKVGEYIRSKGKDALLALLINYQPG